jgi:membrane-bound inhibitor of C-type lysozyme
VKADLWKPVPVYIFMHKKMLLRTIPFLAIVIFGCAHFSPASMFAASGTAADGKIISYRCESGHDVDAIYPSDTTIIIRYAGKSYEMAISISASGARYVGGGLEWWTKGTGPGSTGTLFRHESDGTTGEIIQRCEEQR